MRLGECRLQNFGSYLNLEFDFRNQGLTLISGPTGSGKSTLMDAAAWCLYGVTAKDGNADEIRSWLTPDEPTTGELEIELPNGKIMVCRSRAPNDLYWIEHTGGGGKSRGKDLQDTQKLLEARLAVSAETFLTSAYFHEFSQVGTFFTAKAKDRRQVFERIADLSFPNSLAARAAAARKETRDGISAAESDCQRRAGQLDELVMGHAKLQNRRNAWESTHKTNLRELQVCFENFELEKESKIQAAQTKHDAWETQKDKETDKLIEKITKITEWLSEQEDSKELTRARLEAANSRCDTCGGPKESKKVGEIEAKLAEIRTKEEKIESLQDSLFRLGKEVSPYAALLESAKASTNYYGESLEKEKQTINPYDSQLQELEEKEYNITYEQEKALASIKAMKMRASALDQIQDLSDLLRTELLKKAVSEIQSATVARLEKYFDAEVRVSFTLGDTDSLDVSIQKSGYECVYRQLSKGQRQMLKLCFAVSVMEAAANNAGVNFPCLFMDEALDGLDVATKVKAFSLFEELSLKHESVLLIDHSDEFKSMFSKRYSISLDGDESTIREDDSV